jgi:O-antigen/teichoic acid export membrane protein
MAKESSINLIVRNAGIHGVGIVLNAVIMFASSVVITRTIGAELFGKYSLALSLFQVAGLFGIFGMDTGVVRLTSKYVANRDPGSVKGTLVGGMALTTILSTGLVLIVVFLAPVLASKVFKGVEGIDLILRVYIIGLPFFSLMMVINAYGQGLKTLKYSVMVELILRPVIRFCVIVILFVVGLRLFAVVFGSVFSFIMAAVIAFCFARKISPFDFGTTRATPVTRELFFYSLPLLLARFMLAIVPRSNTIMVGYFTDSMNTGLFGAAATLAPFMSLSLQSFGKIFAPVAAELWEAGNLLELERRLKSVAKWTFSINLPICLVVLLFAPGLLLAFGSDFTPAALTVRLIAIGQILNVLVGPVGFVLTMTGRQKLNLINSIGIAIVNIGLNVVFIPRWGIAGAGFGMMMSLSIVNIVRVIEVKTIYGFTPFRWDVLKPVAAGGISAAALYLLNRHLMWYDFRHTVVLCAAFMIAYIAILYAFGLKEEKQVLADILRRRKG